MKIYHNPRCTKSRNALKLIQDKGLEIEIVEYLKTPLNTDELNSITKLIGLTPEQIVRKNEEVYKNEFKGKSLTNEQWIDALISNPKLIQRPIIIANEKGIIGRDQNELSLFLSQLK
tara:strand:- start:896 stop:1246 length:351 start_codon:yes stop_codon:yes gene_type:complete